MDLPTFVQQLQEEDFRPRMRVGVTTGYAVTGALLVLAVIVDGLGLLPNADQLYLLALFKLGTNSLQWLAVRRQRYVLGAAFVNMLADVVLITAMVYFTGGPYSSLLPAYLIALAIVGGLSNAGVTIVLSALMALSHTTMLLLMKLGVLVQQPTIRDRLALSGQPLGWDFVIVDSLKLFLFLAALTLTIASVIGLLRRKERELREAHEELLEAVRRRDEFIATVTHELKTPIHGVLGMTEVIQEEVYGPVTEQQHEALDGVRGAGVRLLAMVENLLQFERSQSGDLSVDVSEFDVGEVVDEALESVQWAAMGKKLDLAVNVDVTTMRSDRRLVRLILANLLANAMRFTPDGGRVVIDVTHADGHAVIAVTDDGPGVAQHEREALLDEFWEVRESARAFGGTGLGLAVVRRVVEALDGTIDVLGGEEATFRVQIPISES